MHPFAKMPHNLLKFGSANNFSGNIAEWALKGIVKDHAEKTQRQPDKFAELCVICEYESNVIKHVMTDISSQIGVSTHSSKTNNERWESGGRYAIHFCKTKHSLCVGWRIFVQLFCCVSFLVLGEIVFGVTFVHIPKQLWHCVSFLVLVGNSF
jgi:hypothetical protein